MRFDEAMALPDMAPVYCIDGKFGVLIRWYQDAVSVGVQVPGEPDIRVIPVERLVNLGNGALRENQGPVA